MIIDDVHEIAFVHIPKCAGTTIRQYLQPYDGSKGQFTARVDEHDDLGMLDYVHIPLFVLKEYFPKEFEAIKKYWSFAVVRDPYARFASSVSQRLKMYGDKPIRTMSYKDVRIEIDKCVDFLNKNSGLEVCLPHDYIHFQRQVDYIYLGKERIVDSIYTTEEVGGLISIICERLGKKDEGAVAESKMLENKNNTIVYRNAYIRIVIESAKPLIRYLASVVPELFKDKIRSVVYVDRDKKIGSVFSDPAVREFVTQYYCDDIALYEKVSGKK